MRRLLLLFMTFTSGCAAFSCMSAKPTETTAASTPTFTIREIMQSMVQPRAESLWNAVSTSVTEKGIETKAPSNDEEWSKMRYEAVTLAEAMNLIVMPGRAVAKPGDHSKDPSAELEPEQIEVLINNDRETWAKLARALQDSVMVSIKAIDEKKVDALSDAGGEIDNACETCHKKYWYPNDVTPEKK